MKQNFYSDNVSGASPEILAALVAANEGDAAPDGNDPYRYADLAPERPEDRRGERRPVSAPR